MSAFDKKRVFFLALIIFINSLLAGLALRFYAYPSHTDRTELGIDDFIYMSDLEYHAEDRSVMTLSNDSFMWAYPDRAIDIKRLTLYFDNHSHRDWSLQVFFDSENSGIIESNSVVRTIGGNDNRVVIDVNKKAVSTIRIDWGTEAGRFYSLSKVEINTIPIDIKVVFYIAIFIALNAMGMICFFADIKMGKTIGVAFARSLIKAILSTAVFCMFSAYGLLWKNDGEYVAFGALLIIFSILNVLNGVIDRQLQKKACSRFDYKSFGTPVKKAITILIPLSYAILLLNNTQIINIRHVEEFFTACLVVLIGFLLFLFSVEYRMIENRLCANFMLLMIAGALISFYIQGNFRTFYVLAFFVFPALAYGINEKKLLVPIFIIHVTALLITYILALTNVYEYNVVQSVDTVKRGLGFFHGNNASIRVFDAVILFAFINNDGVKRIKMLETIIVSILAFFFVWKWTGGRTSMIGLLCILVITFLFLVFSYIPAKIKKRFEKLYIVPLIIAQSIPVILCLASIILPALYQNNKLPIIDFFGKWFDTSNLYGRVGLSQIALRDYSIHPFGQYIFQSAEGGVYFIIDNAYVSLLLKEGAVLLVCYFIMLTVMNIRLWKKKQYCRMFLLTIIPIIGFSELVVANPIDNVLASSSFNASEEEKKDEKENKKDLFKLVFSIGIIGIWIALIPGIIAFLKTIFEAYEIGKIASIIIVTFIVFFSIIVSWLIFSAVKKIFIEKKTVKSQLINLLIPVGFVIFLFILSSIFISKTSKGYEEEIAEDSSIISLISENSDGKIYADKLPAVFRSELSITYSFLHTEDLLYRKNVTLITDIEDDRLDFFTKGFLYLQISQNDAIYTNDLSVINMLESKGYHLRSYNNSAVDVELESLAEQNGLELTDDGYIHLSTSGRSLDRGPYISLGEGKYMVSYLLRKEGKTDGSDENSELCEVSIYDNWGETKLISQIVTGDMFDENGEYLCRIPLIGKTEKCVFQLHPLGDASIDVCAITYSKTPDNEKRIIRDDKGRMAKVEYFDHNGNPIKLVGDYCGIEYEYDDYDRVICKRFLNEEGNPVTTHWGYSEVRYTDNMETGARDATFYDNGQELSDIDGINLVNDIVEIDRWSEWKRPKKGVENYCFYIGSVNLGDKKEGDIYTCSVTIEFSDVKSSAGQWFSFLTQGSADGMWDVGNVWNGNLVYTTEPPEDGVYTYTYTTTVNEAMTHATNFGLEFRCDNWGSGAFRVRDVSVVKGDTPAPWPPGL